MALSLTYQTFLKSKGFVCEHAFKCHNMENFVHRVVGPNNSNIPIGKQEKVNSTS